ncbi:phenylacetate--CoA ligase family protein [Natrinema gelatinilyticum]|uniref:phenylacetate--CoA ligase family protein n=1 Tax=Natrinema gelatinilyticum TaxID=2961571 RepID=UPI0020C32D4F|nr:AMP-binding protein [Natrinema gelatinilyticum]
MVQATLNETDDVIDRLQNAAEYLSQFEFYRERFEEVGLEPEDVDSIETFRQLPTMTPEDLANDYSENPPLGSLIPEQWDVIRTNLTPNPYMDTRMPVPQTSQDIEINNTVNSKAYRNIGVTADDVLLNTANFTPYPFGWAIGGAAEQIGARHIPTGPGDTTEQVEVIEHHGVTTICGFPSFMLKIANEAEDGQLDSVERVICSGEPFTAIDGYREQVRGAFGNDVTVVDGYGLSEFGTGHVAFETREEDGMHLFTEKVFPEVIDPETGELVERGEKGELVLTTLQEEAAPVLRLRTGDLTILEERDSEYGEYVLPEGVFGRVDNMRKIKGVKVYPLELQMHLAGVPHADPENVQLRINRPEGQTDRLEITMGGDPDEADVERITDGIADVINITPDDVQIEAGFEVADDEVVADER